MTKPNTPSEASTGRVDAIGSQIDEEPNANDHPVNFEQTLADLELLVSELEQGEMPLEAAVAAFERGITLSRSCRHALDRAEQRVRILLEEGADGTLADFDAGSGQ